MCAARLDDVILFFIRDRGDEPLSYAASRGLGGPNGPVGPGGPEKHISFNAVQVVQPIQAKINNFQTYRTLTEIAVSSIRASKVSIVSNEIKFIVLRRGMARLPDIDIR